MTWNIMVSTTGNYEAIVHYTCPEADVGSKLELTFFDHVWKGTVSVAHDPPLRGKERDRVPRVGESYMKDFKQLSLGTVRLAKDQGTLTLRASKVARGQVADVRAVELIFKSKE
jgi:hypothetical protein